MSRKGNTWAKALGDTLLQAVANSGPVQAVRDGTPRRIADQLGTWFAHLSTNASTEWTPAMLRHRVVCAFCEDDAMGRCIGCRDHICLAHSHVSYRAELLCDECVASILENAGSNKSPEKAAFEFFHLTPAATLEEVTYLYKSRSKKSHPDQGGGVGDMKEVNKHFATLKRHFQQREVA